MFHSAHICGNSFNIGQILSHKSGEAKKSRKGVHPAEGQPLNLHAGVKPRPNFSKLKELKISAQKSNQQAAGPLTDEMKKVAQNVANMHYGDFPKH
ncbi:hypothetical protein JST97_35970 [bacterium]|nr:hypothetical protein [bacterium]